MARTILRITRERDFHWRGDQRFKRESPGQDCNPEPGFSFSRPRDTTGKRRCFQSVGVHAGQSGQANQLRTPPCANSANTSCSGLPCAVTTRGGLPSPRRLESPRLLHGGFPHAFCQEFLMRRRAKYVARCSRISANQRHIVDVGSGRGVAFILPACFVFGECSVRTSRVKKIFGMMTTC